MSESGPVRVRVTLSDAKGDWPAYTATEAGYFEAFEGFTFLAVDLTRKGKPELDLEVPVLNDETEETLRNFARLLLCDDRMAETVEFVELTGDSMPLPTGPKVLKMPGYSKE